MHYLKGIKRVVKFTVSLWPNMYVSFYMIPVNLQLGSKRRMVKAPVDASQLATVALV